MTSEELLIELKDIAAPQEPGWWLLAPGQIVTGLLVVLLCLSAWLWLKRQRSARLVILARSELARIGRDHDARGDTLVLSRELSRWLKQVALLAFPRARLEAMSGGKWLDFLDETIGDASFTRGPGDIFADAIYRRELRRDAREILALCERWLTAIEPELRRRGPR